MGVFLGCVSLGVGYLSAQPIGSLFIISILQRL